MNKQENTFESDWIVYIGRFEPPHNGHFSTAREALKRARRMIISIGSANAPRDPFKNPLNAEEREEIFRLGFTEEENKRIYFQYVEDRIHQNDEWAGLVRDGVRSILLQYHAGKPENAKIALAIAEKDNTSWYVNMFPEWKKEKIDIMSMLDGDNPLGATKIRELMFTGHVAYIQSAVPPAVYEWLKKFTHDPEFTILKEDYLQGVAYERLYENHPKGHTINFYTADPVVIQSNHVLMIKRKNSPGKGLWALPGGHVNSNETAEQASLRELKEETSINLTDKTLRNALKAEKIFDHPDRSMRARITKKNARTVTYSFFYKLDDASDLPRVKAGDDAEEAWWFSRDEIKRMRAQIFEDHLDQINYWFARIK